MRTGVYLKFCQVYQIDVLGNIPFLNEPLIGHLKVELPNYIARSTDVNPPDNVHNCSNAKKHKR